MNIFKEFLFRNIKFLFELLTRWVNFYLITFELLTHSWKIKKLFRVTNLKSKKQSWFRGLSRLLYWNKILHNSELFGKNVSMLDFVILDINLAPNSSCLWSLKHSTRYAIVFWKKKLLSLAYVVVRKDGVFILILGFQWLVQVHWYKVYKIPEDYSVATSITKNNHI